LDCWNFKNVPHESQFFHTMKPLVKNFNIQIVYHEYAPGTGEYLRFVIVTPDPETAWAYDPLASRPVLLRARNTCSVAKFQRWLREHYPQARFSGSIGQFSMVVFWEMGDAYFDRRAARGEIEQ